MCRLKLKDFFKLNRYNALFIVVIKSVEFKCVISRKILKQFAKRKSFKFNFELFNRHILYRNFV